MILRATGLATLLASFLLIGPARAANFVIADGDVAALATAITTANGNGETDTIALAAGGFYSLTTAAEPGNGLPAITGPLTIDGNGATIQRSPQAANFRIIEIRMPATVVLNGLTISNGNAGGRDSLTSRGGNIAILAPPEMEVARPRGAMTNAVSLNTCLVQSGIAGIGGGIFVEPADVAVTIIGGFVVANTGARGGGIALLGAAQLQIDGTYIGSNSAAGFTSPGGTGAIGAGILTAGTATVTITDAFVSGNETAPGVGTEESLGGGIADIGGATYTIVRTELIGNLNRFSAVANRGAGIYAGSPNGTFAIANTTFSNNLSVDGGAINNHGGSAVSLRNVTIARNFATNGAGVAVTGGNGGTLTLANTIITENTADTGPDCAGPITSLGYNLLGDTTGCTVTTTTGDVVGADALLGGATDNGGGTTTHALLLGSPAIEGGDPDGCKDAANVTLTTDQRGFSRPVGARCDIGAFERGAVVEICDNCLDDDANQLVDRDDPTCTPLTDAGGATLGDPGRGKALGSCAATLTKAGAKLLGGEIKRLQKCLQTAFACVQVKRNDAKCVAKATKVCQAALDKRPAELAKYGAAVRAKCGPPALAEGDLLDDAGLAFRREAPACATVIASVDDVVACTGSFHTCRAQQMVGMQVPRALELVQMAQVNGLGFACLPGSADGQLEGAGEPGIEGKRAVTCEKALMKAGAKFASGKLKLVRTCALAVSKCQQEKAADAKCLPKAQQTCAKAIAKLTGPKGLEQKLGEAIVKACAEPGLGLPFLLSDVGIGYEARALECGGLGAGALDSVAPVGTCVNRQHACRVEQALEAELPRYRELLTTGGVTLP